MAQATQMQYNSSLLARAEKERCAKSRPGRVEDRLQLYKEKYESRADQLRREQQSLELNVVASPKINPVSERIAAQMNVYTCHKRGIERTKSGGPTAAEWEEGGRRKTGAHKAGR